MPQFYPEHTPSTDDSFTQGYLDAAEWLLDEDLDRSKVRGWTKAAIAKAAVECKAFQEANGDDLGRYQDTTGRDLGSAGHDFFLTRNGHGAGYWDRGDDACLTRLTDAAKGCGEADPYLWRGRLNWG